MRIVPFNETYLRTMSAIFVEEYSEKEIEWDIQTALKYFKRYIDDFPYYCFVAISEKDEFLGGICCRVDPYYRGTYLFVESLEVAEDQRGKGVATLLFKTLVERAKKKGIDGIYFIADKRKEFPRSWFIKLGFEESGWIEYEAKLSSLKF